MERLLIFLVGVSEPYREAFEEAALRESAELIAVEGELPALGPELGSEVWPSLCVLAVRGAAAEHLDHLRRLRKSLRSVPVVVLAEGVEIDALVRLVREGVADLIGLPASPGDVAARALVHARMPNAAVGTEDLVGASPSMRELRRALAAVAPMRSTVLLTGETGTGKGLVARLLHRLSERRDRPFVHVDCAALSPTVIESELFGHERGAFTGAVARHRGRFELAEEGSIFLDEIAELSPPLQAKLLRVLQDREYERIGGTETHTLRARVIAATSRDLPREVESGRFRADLLFRLKVFELRIPPLRERLSDLPLLVRAGVERLGSQLDLPVPRIGDSFYAVLTSHSWPGNVRELVNLLERLLIQSGGRVLEADDLDGLLDEPSRGCPAGDPDVRPGLGCDPTVSLHERDAVAAVLAGVGGNVARAARRLGVPRSTLRYRIRQLGLTDRIPKD